MGNKLGIALLIVLILIQGVICWNTYWTGKYTAASFAIQYFGVDKADNLLSYSKLKEQMMSGHTITADSFKIPVDALGRPA